MVATLLPRMIQSAVFFTVLFFAAIISPASMAQDSQVEQDSSLEAEVLKEIEQYYLDFSDRDWEAFSDHFWGGATLATIWPAAGETAPSVWVSSIPEFVEQAPSGPGSKPIFSERMTASAVKVEGKLAQVWAHYDAEFGEEGKLMKWSGIDAFTLLKFEGRWKIVSLSYVSQ